MQLTAAAADIVDYYSVQCKIKYSLKHIGLNNAILIV
jgi:hypothetical protein